jgi:hypothetical protein
MVEKPGFRVECRILGNDDEMVDGVQAETDRIEFFVLLDFERELHG